MLRRSFILLLLAGRLCGQSYEELFRDASVLSTRGDYGAAIAKYKEALRLRPGAPEALSNLGVMYHMAGLYQQSVDTMTQVARSQPGLFPARLILGLDLVRLQRAADALPHLKFAVQAEPSNEEAVHGLAAAYVALNQLQDAAGIYERRTSSVPADADAWYGMGLCYERLAEAASRRLSRSPGGSALDRQFLAEFLLDRGENRLAEEALREATALDRQVPSAAARAEYEQARSLAERSRKAFLHLVEIAPDAWQSRLFLGDLHRQQRHFPEAIQHYQAVEKMQPGNPAPLLGLATVHWELGEFEQAEAYLNRVLKLNPKASQALFQLGNIRVRQHRDEDAIPLLQEFLKAQPDSLSAWADIGRAYFHLGRYEQAVPYLQRARPIDDRGEIHYQLATALGKLNRTGEAQEALRISSQLRQRQLEKEQRLKSSNRDP